MVDVQVYILNYTHPFCFYSLLSDPISLAETGQVILSKVKREDVWQRDWQLSATP